MNRKVTYVNLHAEAFIPGIGVLGKVFPSQSRTLQNLSMESTAAGLMMSFTEKGILVEVLIPSANVVLMKLAPEDKAVKAVKSA